MYALFMIYIPSKIQGSTPYSKSLVFLDQCVHSKGNNTKVNSHCISSDFSPKWVLVRLVLLTNVKFQKKKKNILVGLGAFQILESWKEIMDLYCQIKLWIGYHQLLLHPQRRLSTVGKTGLPQHLAPVLAPTALSPRKRQIRKAEVASCCTVRGTQWSPVPEGASLQRAMSLPHLP